MCLMRVSGGYCGCDRMVSDSAMPLLGSEAAVDTARYETYSIDQWSSESVVCASLWVFDSASIRMSIY